MSNAQIGQEPVQVIISEAPQTGAHVRIGQEPVEVLFEHNLPNLRLGQLPIQVLQQKKRRQPRITINVG